MTFGCRGGGGLDELGHTEEVAANLPLIAAIIPVKVAPFAPLFEYVRNTIHKKPVLGIIQRSAEAFAYLDLFQCRYGRINLLVEESYIHVAGHQHNGDRGGGGAPSRRRQGSPQRPRGLVDCFYALTDFCRRSFAVAVGRVAR